MQNRHQKRHQENAPLFPAHFAPVSPGKMQDVAVRAQVSLGTVSYVLKGSQSKRYVAAATRERVLKAAEELRYVPNARAHSLRVGQSKVIGFYLNPTLSQYVRCPYQAELVCGILDGCMARGRDLLLRSDLHERPAPEIYNALRDGRIDGLILAMPHLDSLAKMVSGGHLPAIVAGDPFPGLHSVTVDDAGGSALLARHLYERGHRICLYGSCGQTPASGVRRGKAFVECAAQLGMQVHVVELSSAPDQSEILLQHWESFAPHERPTAVAFWYDHAAYRFLETCNKRGIRAPRDLAVVGFDALHWHNLDYLGYTLTTIRAPWALVAKTAAELLMELIEGHRVPQETVVPVEFVQGNTT